MKLVSPYITRLNKVNFKFVPARKGTKHLIVVFTSIRAKQDWLDFDQDGPLLKFNRSNILWIYDDFSDDYSYYMAQDRNFSIESSVISLIHAVREELELTVKECTAVGMSKGGSAALRIGISCNFSNIVAVVPQIAIGAYLSNRKRLSIIRHMAGGSEVSDIKWLDELVPQSIFSDANYDRNVYILTSPYDPHCLDYLPRVLPRLREYSNFNLISTASDLSRNHVQTLHYNVPLVVSLLGIISEGITPIFGETSNGPGFDGSGHRDGHGMLSEKHGGSLVDGVARLSALEAEVKNGNLELTRAAENIVSVERKLKVALDELASSQMQVEKQAAINENTLSTLAALRSSKLGRVQNYIWHQRAKFHRLTVR